MNILLIIVGILMVYHTIDGYRKGVLRKSVSAFSLIISLVLVMIAVPWLNGFLRETTYYESIQKKCTESFLKTEFDPEVKTEQIKAIESMELPGFVKELLVENNNGEIYDVLEVDDFYEYVGAYLANLVLWAVSFVISFIIVWILFKILVTVLDVVAKLPILRTINHVAGAVLGVAVAIMAVWVLFILITIFGNNEICSSLYRMIGDNEFLLLLYNRNLILKLLVSMIL